MNQDKIIRVNDKLFQFINKEHDTKKYNLFKKSEWLVTDIHSVKYENQDLKYYVSFENFNGLHFTKSWISEKEIYAPELLKKFLLNRKITRTTEKIQIDNMGKNLPNNITNLYSDDLFCEKINIINF